MKARALLYSLLLHVVPVLGLVALLGRNETSKNSAPSAVAEAQIGDVFVTAKPQETQASSSDPGVLSDAISANHFGIPSGEAEPIGKIEPHYPPMSRKLGEEGEAVFILTIDARGNVLQAALEQSAGFSRLDEAAKSALLAATFRVPGEVKTAPFRKRYRIEFRLSSPSR